MLTVYQACGRANTVQMQPLPSQSPLIGEEDCPISGPLYEGGSAPAWRAVVRESFPEEVAP